MKLRQLLKLLIFCSTILFLHFKTVHSVFAQVVFEDDFSNGYEKWQDVRSTFDLWSIIEEQANIFINKQSTLAELIPKDEFWNTEWKNYVYSVEYTYLEGADKLLSFWFKDPLNWYQFHFVGNSYILSHVKDGYEIWRKQGPLVLDAGKSYLFETYLNEGNIQFFVDGTQIFDETDPTFDSDHGRIGIKSGAGAIYPTHVQFDNVKVTLVNENETSETLDTILKIKPLKQTDEAWNNIEYDSAKKWSPDSYGIGEWGCLVTSINMILEYHNITHFPDGTEITPKALNAWLQKQPDGFISSGLVNWSAVTRLVKEIHDTTGSVNLEYSRIPNTETEEKESYIPAITQIKENKPVILEIPGHFLVGNGFMQNESDLYITDPAYSYSLFSEHKTNLRSTRLLTPSFTDLSYIYVTHDNSIEISITNELSEQPENYQSYTESLTGFHTQKNSKETIIHEIQKPETGSYFITVKNDSDDFKEYTLTIYAYDIDANLTDLSYTGIISPKSETKLQINFSKDESSSLSSQTNYDTLLSDITYFKNTNQITKFYVKNELSVLAGAANQATKSEVKLRYNAALKNTISWYSAYISETAQHDLLHRIEELSKNLN